MTCLIVFFMCFSVAYGQISDVQEAADSARGAFLSGRLEDAEKGYQYLVMRSSDLARSFGPTASLAVLAKDSGRPEEAIALWVKATLLAKEDPLAWNQRGWSYLALERYSQAREAFKEALDISTNPSFTAEARLGLALTELRDAGPRRATQAFQDIFGKDSISLSFVAQRLGEIYFQAGKYHQANQYFKQALAQDPLLLEAEVGLGKLYKEMGFFEAAWAAYWTLWNLDPQDSLYEKWMKDIQKDMNKNPKDIRPWRRMAWPILTSLQTYPPSPKLRVALFSDSAGKPAAAVRFYFISQSDFKIVDQRMGSVIAGKKNSRWEVRYSPEHLVYELRSSQGQLEYSTRQSFRIEPLSSGASVLLKNIELLSEAGVDGGDRELRGVVECRPRAEGFEVVNEIPLDDYLFGAVSQGWPNEAPLEAFKARAVVLRARSLWLKSHPLHEGDSWELCDSAHCNLYSGLQQESVNGVRGVRETRGEILEQEQQPPETHLHVSCGGLTENGVQDTSTSSSPPWKSPADLEKWVRSFTFQGLFCQTSNLSMPTEAGWIRWISVADILRRQNRKKNIGKLKALIPSKRSASGRLISLKLEGTLGSDVAEGEQAIRNLLAPGSLRSTLFVFQPLYEGKRPESYLLWGLGTGSGMGLCEAGSLGLASIGRHHKEILSHYFPNLKLKTTKY